MNPRQHQLHNNYLLFRYWSKSVPVFRASKMLQRPVLRRRFLSRTLETMPPFSANCDFFLALVCGYNLDYPGKLANRFRASTIMYIMLKFFSSRLESGAVAENLREFVDAEEVDPNSPTLYAGERPFVGEVGSDR